MSRSTPDSVHPYGSVSFTPEGAVRAHTADFHRTLGQAIAYARAIPYGRVIVAADELELMVLAVDRLRGREGV